MALSPQQLKILRTLAQITGYIEYPELAEKAGELKSSVRAQLTKMRTLKYVESDPDDSKKWQITQAGMKEAARSEEPDKPTNRGGAPAKKSEPVNSNRGTVTVEVETGEEEEPVPAKPEPKKAAPPPRKQPPAQVSVEEPENSGRQEPTLSREEMGLTEYQIFIKMGKDMGGVVPEKLMGIADVVFGDDPYNLDRVWYNLSAMNIAIDLRKQWFMLWKNYLKQSGKPSEMSSLLQAELSPPNKRTEDQRKEMAEQGRDWEVEEDDEGIFSAERIGDGLGTYTFKEATQTVIIKNRARRAAATSAPQQYPQEPASQLLTALAPYLNRETPKDSVAELITALAPFMKDNTVETKLEEVVKAVTTQSNKGGGLGDILTNLPQYTSALQTLAPIIRAMLGVSNGAPQPAAPQSSPIQMMNPDGTPMVFNIQDFLTIQRFQAEQKREDMSAQGKQEFIGEVKNFMSKIANAAAKAGG